MIWQDNDNLHRCLSFPSQDYRIIVRDSVKLTVSLDGDFEHGINSTQYHSVAKVSKPTATRHLATLVQQGCLIRSKSDGRSTQYLLVQ